VIGDPPSEFNYQVISILCLVDETFVAALLIIGVEANTKVFLMENSPSPLAFYALILY
jgi:hypothetical protein